MKPIIFILAAILLIGVASAQVSITAPSSIHIDTYPGETHVVNITITSDGYYVVNFNTSFDGITISPQQIVTNGSIQNFTLYLTFPYDIASGETSFDANAFISEVQVVNNTNTIIYVPVNPPNSNGFGAQGGYIYIVNNTNTTIYVPINNSNQSFWLWPIINTKPFNQVTTGDVIAYVISIIIILAFIYILVRFNKMNDKKNNKKRKDDKLS